MKTFQKIVELGKLIGTTMIFVPTMLVTINYFLAVTVIDGFRAGFEDGKS